MNMIFDFDPPAKFINQAKEIVSLGYRNGLPKAISSVDLTVDFVKEIVRYSSNNLFIDLVAFGIAKDGAVDWSDKEWLDEMDNKVIPEIYRRIKWQYEGKSEVVFDVFFIARVLKAFDDVALEEAIKDFL